MVFVLVASLLSVVGPAASTESGRSHLGFFDGNRGSWALDGYSVFHFGVPGDWPLLCDWNGDGVDTVGLYRPTSGFLYLRGTNGFGVADTEIYYGIPEDKPVCGDWDGDGIDTIGIYRPSTSTFYLRNSNTQGFADIQFTFGDGRGEPIAGNWDGGGGDTVGLWRPWNGMLQLAAGHTSRVEIQRWWGGSSDQVVTGDWDDDGRDTVGVYRYSDGFLHLMDLGEAAGSPLDHWIGKRSGTAVAGATGDGSATVPPGAISVWPGEDIQAAANSAGPGATLYIRAGVHRMQKVKTRDNQTFVGEPGAVLNGSRVLSGWQLDGSRWWVGGQIQQGSLHGSCEDARPRCNRPEDLFLDNVRLEHVDSVFNVAPGKWYFDYGADRIYVGDNPGGRLVETSVTDHAFYGQTSNVTISGLTIEKYANPAQHGAIDTRLDNRDATSGNNWLIVGNEVRLTHGVGIKAGNNARVVENNIHHNGQLGVGAVGSNPLVEGNEIANNGTLGFELDWERGGTKFAGTVGAVVRDNYVHDNIGRGLWADVNAYDSLFEGNVVVSNTHAGIFYEISYVAMIRDNYVAANGYGHSGWLWGGGIVVAGSPDVEIYNNTLVNNADGISIVEQDRSSDPALYGPHITKNTYVHNNHVTMGQGHTGLAQDIGNNSVFTSRNNRFIGNVYVTGSGDFFEWDNRQLNFDEWRSYGQE